LGEAVLPIFRVALGSLVALVQLVGCTSGPPPTGVPHEVSATATGTAMRRPDSITPKGAYEAVSDYRIGANDLLDISVFGVDTLSRTVRVNSLGMIGLPLVGSVHAGGKTVSELESEIAKLLGKDYVQNPQVSVFVKEFTSQRVTVEGAVIGAGIFPLTGKTTLLQTIAMAKGLDPLADPSSVVIFRMVDGKKMAAIFDVERIEHGKMEDPFVYGDDIVVVDRSGGRTFLKNVTDTIRGLIGFQPIH
jgi:polysaccharide export outer membrane protein